MPDLLDKDIREIIFTYFESRYEKLRIIEEKPIGKCRCDFMIITPDSICGCEIKSDHDTYTRLERQVKAYDCFFDYNYCIVGESHKKGVFGKLPAHWGVILVDNSGGVSVLREPSPKKRSPLKNLLSFLWKNELS
ncbi:MAG: sce7726 family protein, partial [Clostridia bacterium]